MPETHARIRMKQPDGAVEESIVSFPLKTGDEAFRFLEAFEAKCGGPIRDAKRDRRFESVMKERNATAAKAA